MFFSQDDCIVLKLLDGKTKHSERKIVTNLQEKAGLDLAFNTESKRWTKLVLPKAEVGVQTVVELINILKQLAGEYNE